MSDHRQCRVCESANVVVAGRVEYLAGFPCDIVDCRGCGCLTSVNDQPVHASLHAVPAISYYASYRDLASQCRRLFSERDRAGMEALLRAQRKYAFVLDRLNTLPKEARILEWGCSRGYLAAASLLAGRSVLGVDVAPDAVAAARDAFGDHFVTDDSPRIAGDGPYDAIYHVGLIGCVPDPLGLTRRLLNLLKPNGILFFNAPNRDAMNLRGQLWLDTAPPPDVVTLFRQGFWRAHAEAGVVVDERAETTAAPESTVKTLQRWFGPTWQSPAPSPANLPCAQRWTQPRPRAAWRALEAVAAKVSSLSGIRFGRWPDEFGLFVVMTKS
jgi:SAM-dependent methyltransferase